MGDGSGRGAERGADLVPSGSWLRVYCVALVGALLALGFKRVGSAPAEHPDMLGHVALLAALLVLLAPIFPAIKAFGVSVRRELQRVESEVKREVASIRLELRASSESRSNAETNLTFNGLPEMLVPLLGPQMKSAISDVLRAQGKSVPVDSHVAPSVPLDVAYLFAVRYRVEIELRRIAAAKLIDASRKPITHIVRMLSDAQALPVELVATIVEIYTTGSRAIHGEPVTAAQSEFTRSVAPGLIEALQAIA